MSEIGDSLIHFSSKVTTFEEKWNNLPGSSCKWSIFAWKIDIFVKLPEKSEIFWEFAWKNLNFFDPDPQPPRFQTRLTPLLSIY